MNFVKHWLYNQKAITDMSKKLQNKLGSNIFTVSNIGAIYNFEAKLSTFLRDAKANFEYYNPHITVMRELSIYDNSSFQRRPQ